MSIIRNLFKDALGSMIQERHTGIGRRMSKELSRAISGKRLVRKYATKSIPAFRSPDVPYFPRSAFGRVLNSPHYLHEQSHGIAPLYVGCFFLSRAQDNRNKQTNKDSNAKKGLSYNAQNVLHHQMRIPH